MSLQSRALKAVLVAPRRAAKTIRADYIGGGGWGRRGGWAGVAAVAVGDSDPGAEAGTADGAEEGEDCALERGGP
jgi:hypothetical protein